MDPFSVKIPQKTKLLMNGYLRECICDQSDIPQLIIQICGCLYYYPYIFDTNMSHEHVEINEDKTIAISSVYTSGYRNAFIVGEYDDKSENVFKFKLKKHGSIFWGMAIDYKSKTYMGGQENTYSLASWNGKIYHNRKTMPFKYPKRELSIGDVITINLKGGTISFHVNNQEIGGRYQLMENLKFKIGVSLDHKHDEVEIVW